MQSIFSPKPPERATKKLPAGLYHLIEWALLVLVLSVFFFRNIAYVPFHGDESQWIATSLYLEAFFNRDFAPPEWIVEDTLDEELQERFPAWVESGLGDMQPPNKIWDTHYWTLTQPPVVRYVIAIGRLLGGYHNNELNTPWDFDASQRENETQGNLPSRELLSAVRTVMAILGIISGMILFWLVRKTSGITAGWCFVFLYALSGYLLLHLRRAMGDSSLLFFTCLAMLTGTLALQAWEKIRRNTWQESSYRQRILPFFWLILMGIAAGLAGASKLNGLGIAIAGIVLSWAMAFSGQGLAHHRARLGFALGASLLVLISCVITFISVNPYLYPNPIKRTAAMFVLRTWEMEYKQNSRWGMPTLNQRLQTIPRRILEDYTITRIGILNIILGSTGLFLLLQSTWMWLRNKENSPASLVLLAVGCVTVLPALTTPLDWDRYYLYPVVFFSVLLAVGMGKGLNYAYEKFQEEMRR